MEWKPIAVRLRGRPKRKWKDDAKQDIKIMKVMDKQSKIRKEWK
jgi:hypothetical protein